MSRNPLPPILNNLGWNNIVNIWCRPLGRNWLKNNKLCTGIKDYNPKSMSYRKKYHVWVTHPSFGTAMTKVFSQVLVWRGSNEFKGKCQRDRINTKGRMFRILSVSLIHVVITFTVLYKPLGDKTWHERDLAVKKYGEIWL